MKRSFKFRSKAKKRARIAFSQLHSPPVLIYQMGKVGSTTVYKSLKNTSLRRSLLFLHILSDGLDNSISRHKASGFDPLPFHLYLSRATRKELQRRPETRIKVISLVRDPIAFAVSNIFQNPEFHKEFTDPQTGDISAEKVVNAVENDDFNQTVFAYVHDWFDKEMCTVFGIDVFSVPFPQDQGYCLYTNGNVELLLIRLEDLSEVGPESIADFLNLPEPLVLEKSNVRKKSRDSDSYNAVMSRVRFTRDLCRVAYGGKFTKHFYSNEHIKEFMKRWHEPAQMASGQSYHH